MSQRDKPTERNKTVKDCTLDQNGYPTNPRSIFIGIRRDYLPNLQEFRMRLLGRPSNRVAMTIRNLGTWKTLYGRVTSIQEFPDGVVIHFPQIIKESPLKWPDAILWIPDKGSAGILNPQYRELTNEEIQRGLDEMSYNHMVAVSTLIYIIDGLFRDRDCLPYGITKGQVEQMTQFHKITLLEKICRWRPEVRQGLGDLNGVMEFLQRVDENGFRTAEDSRRR